MILAAGPFFLGPPDVGKYVVFVAYGNADSGRPLKRRPARVMWPQYYRMTSSAVIPAT